MIPNSPSQTLSPEETLVSAIPFPAIPLIEKTKRPAIKGWQTVVLGAYPTKGHHGLVIPDGYLVIDADTEDALTDVMVDFKLFPTRVVKTPRGWHVYKKIPLGLKLKMKQPLYPNVDFKTQGGFVVGPGSRTEAGDYTLRTGDQEITDASAEFLATLEEATKPSAKGSEPSLLLASQFESECKIGRIAIQGQNGDNTTYSFACNGRDLGLPKETVYAAMRDHWNPRCQPPWSDRELYGKVENAYKYAQNAAGSLTPEAQFTLDMADQAVNPQDHTQRSTAPTAQPNVADKVIACAADAELWHDSSRTAYATIFNSGHAEHYAVRSKAFEEWLERSYRTRCGKMPSEQAMKSALRSIDGDARYSGAIHQAGLRVAEHDSKIYVDLADSEWRAVEISDTGWRVVDSPPIRFVRTDNMQPLPIPERAGP